MKSAYGILMICFVFVACGEEIEPLKPLQKGMPNTKTLSTGDVVYDINGEWDAILDSGPSGKMEDIINITQEGNKFVGIKLIGNQCFPKGSETIKGELEKNGFKSFHTNTASGWTSANTKIGEKCNKIVIETPSAGITVDLTLTRK